MNQGERRERRAASVLTIGESDSSGRGGVQASARVCAALGCHPLSAVTQVASRGGVGKDQALAMPLEALATQLTDAMEGLGADAIKIGALAQPKGAVLVARLIGKEPRVPVVVDPRLFDRFSKRCALEALDDVVRGKILRLATVACVNIFEAEALTRMTVRDMDSRRDALKALYGLGVSVPMVMSSQNDRHAMDLVYDGTGFVEFGGDRIEVEHQGGAGAVLTAAIAAHMARGLSALEAIERARGLVSASIRAAARVSEGFRPVNPLAEMYRSAGLEYAVLDDGDEQGDEGR